MKIRGDQLTRYKTTCTEKLAKKPISVVLPEETDNFVRSLPNRTDWLRKVIEDASRKEKEGSSHG